METTIEWHHRAPDFKMVPTLKGPRKICCTCLTPMKLKLDHLNRPYFKCQKCGTEALP